VRERKRERERGAVYPGQNNYLPFLHAGGTFSPLKTWEGEPPLEVCELPPTEHARTHVNASARARIHAPLVRPVCVCARARAPSTYTGAFLILSTSITASP